jgi:hypothetical protein
MRDTEHVEDDRKHAYHQRPEHRAPDEAVHAARARIATDSCTVVFAMWPPSVRQRTRQTQPRVVQ